MSQTTDPGQPAPTGGPPRDSGRELRNIFGQFASGVTVVTAANRDGTPHGATVTAFTSVSLEPRLAQVTLTTTSRACGILTDNNFAINILAENQTDVGLHFAGRPSVDVLPWNDSGIAPALDGTLATIWCTPWRQYDGGDHTIFIGEIVDAVANPDLAPLLFFRSTFHHLGPKSHETGWSMSGDDPDAGWFGAHSDLTPLPGTSF
ncbi:flavin reductase family protein [Corynebacterium sp. A21]|uniref:flavin reductase family protein n=1 Tax=Corynebacterium sp. A21 TaxID=3457318 RepID=UPI003FD5AC66